MIAIPTPLTRWLPLVTAAFILAGCAALPTGGDRGGPVDRAAAAASRGEPSQASVLYEQAAQASSEPRRSPLYLRAAEAAVAAGDGERAQQLLDQVDANSLGAEDEARLVTAELRAEVAGLPPAQALEHITPPSAGASPLVAARTWSLRAELLFEAGRIVDGVHALVQRSVWLLEPRAVRNNDERIWDRLRAAQSPEQDRSALAGADAITRGWVELAGIAGQVTPDREALTRDLQAWEQRHPGHPATRHILPERLGYQPMSPDMPGDGGRGARVVGLALPLSGQFEGAAGAVRDGFLAGYYEESTPRADVRVYDTNRQRDMAAVIDQARSDGVGILVGPLGKEQVTDLAEMPRLPMPVLALNYRDGADQFPGFYQFGLAPEDEARAVADRAAAEGWRRAIALVPDGDWGQRVLGAFEEALYYAGGNLVDYATYDTSQNDHAEPIKRVLKYTGVREGQAREVATGPDGEPIERGRRQDVDFVFLAAQPSHARLIRTQLRFYRASRLPVLATSHAFTGQVDPDRDIDLNGLMFADMPWVLSRRDVPRLAQIAERWPDDADRYPRLFAMGLDAWRLAARIRAGEMRAGDLFEGATGELYLEPDGQIRRRLDWGKFSRGKPKPIEPARPNDGFIPVNAGQNGT
ncbi:penicillin-binding protein activator [Spectribacter hydrogenoxidans]|uniref:Penicillin-binding protein activator n=1 Tax=Spectribacter hydrogenoxidans TaxID=3075608 RepID=A0ABU3BX27_9GAMM|nr:penicillin-binding protein activator [Salinisphaera sp. W335]MDT0633864.1 penicillin-binding protein activator [Salinisphaera sp. W335]